MHVPCGRCRHCRIQRQSEWAIRCMHEADYHDRTSFLTVTFADLPPNGELDPEHLRLFLKRLRREIYPRKVKYFASGQYGENLGRPHYHLILFGEDETSLQFEYAGRAKGVNYGMLDSWPAGTSYFGDATRQSAAYVARYMQQDSREEHYDGLRPPFGRKSNGIGKQYALDNRERLIRNLGDSYMGTPVILPRQYRTWIGMPAEDWQAHGKEKYEERYREFIKKYGHDPTRIGKEMRRHLDQHDRNLLALIELKEARKNEISVHSSRHSEGGD